jgi:peptidoglycan-associated lipoprotein
MRLSVAKGWLVLVPALFLGACASTPEAEDSTSSQDEQVAQDTTALEQPAVEVQPIADTPTEEEIAAQRDAELRQEKVIYFEFDDSAIQDDFVEILAAHGRFLAANPSVNIRLLGHADERGTPEYNIALGERRGNSVARALMSYGVGRNQLEVISYGEERPAVIGHDTASWAANRRVEIEY